VSTPCGVSIELKCLAALQAAQATLSRQIVSHARTYLVSKGAELSDDDVKVLRGDGAYQIAKFYYLAEEYDLANRRKIRLFLDSHNEEMREYASNKEKRDSIGFTKVSAEAAIFSEPQIERVVLSITKGKLRLDQADVGRILWHLISPETTRKALVTLAKGGLITRVNIGQMLVISNGKLEQYFKNHLTFIASTLNGSSNGSGEGGP